MMKKYIISILIALILLQLGCSYFDEELPQDDKIARVHDAFLFKIDLEGIVEPGISQQDSIKTVERYVDTWIRQQVLLHEAKNNLTPEKMNFERKIEDYRNSLVIFSYEKDFINKNLDTIVSSEQIMEYYEEYKNDFQLKENIVQAIFIKVSLDTPDLNLVRRFYRSDSPEDRVALEDYCVQNASAYFLDDSSWLVFNDLLRNIPLEIRNQEHYLKNNKAVEITDDYYRYFIYIKDYRIKDSVSPLAFEEQNIRNIIINKRKHELINNHRNNIYRNAIRNNSFEIF